MKKLLTSLLITIPLISPLWFNEPVRAEYCSESALQAIMTTRQMHGDLARHARSYEANKAGQTPVERESALVALEAMTSILRGQIMVLRGVPQCSQMYNTVRKLANDRWDFIAKLEIIMTEYQ